MKRNIILIVFVCTSFLLNAQVLWEDNFSSSNWSGKYDVGHSQNIKHIANGGPGGNGCLEITINKGDHYGGAIRYMLKKNHGYEPEELYAEYKVRYDSDMRTYGGKAPGFSGTYDEAGWGNEPGYGKAGWSARGSINCDNQNYGVNTWYVYHTYTNYDAPNCPGSKDYRNCNPFPYDVSNPGSQPHASDKTWGSGLKWGIKGNMQFNQWYTVKQYIKLNTPGQNNGILRAWVNGQLVNEYTNINFRRTNDLKIYAYWFNYYNGGSNTARETGHVRIDDFKLYLSDGGGNTGGGTNLALRKAVTQSSNYNSSLVAANAVDGNRATINHTKNDANAWLQVDLGSVSDITTIEVFNRTSCCQNRLSNFHVFVSEVPFSSTNLNTTKNQSGVGNYYTSGQAGSPTKINVNRKGRYVRVQLAGTNYLHVEELVVYGTAGSSGGGGGNSSNAIPIPGKIEAENYTAMNGIQTQNTSDAGGGKNVGWIGTGDWMDYKVNVQTAGSYTVKFRVASFSNNIKFDLKKGGTTLTSVNSSTTGGWQTWKTVTKTVNLTAGEQTLRILATGPSWNINYMDFAQGSSGGGGTGSVITVQAESFNTTGGTFNDGHVPYGVNRVNGVGINWVNKGDWAQYNNINIPQDGAYEIVYYISSPVTGSTIDFSVGNTKFNTTTVPNNGQWDSYQALKASNTANFTAGNHNIKLTAGSQDWTWNLDKFTLQRVGAMKNAIEEGLAGLSGFNIYPNPATDVLTIQLEETISDEVRYILYNTTGRILSSEIIEDGFHQVSLAELVSGMYIIQLRSGNEVLTKKFIKE